LKEQKGLFKHIDRPLVLLYLTLVLMGWISIYAAVYNDELSDILGLSKFFGKQLLLIITAFVINLLYA